jgi:hypothetical protein
MLVWRREKQSKETKKQRNKETKKQRNKETKKQRNKETKKQRNKKESLSFVSSRHKEVSIVQLVQSGNKRFTVIMESVMKTYIEENYVKPIQQFSKDNNLHEKVDTFTLPDVFPLNTPTNEAISNSLNRTDENHLKSLVRIIFSNFMRGNQDFHLLGWLRICGVLVQCFDPKLDDITATTKLSLFLILSRFKGTTLKCAFPTIWKLSARLFEEQLPPLITGLLNCPAVHAAFTKAPYTDRYQFPPKIILVDNLMVGLRGWVCFSNYIAISSQVFSGAFRQDLSDYYPRVLDVFTLIVREAKHGVLRMEKNNFNSSAPALYPQADPPESGYLIEKEIWNGLIPKWNDADSQEGAELAKQILDDFASTGDLVISDVIRDRIRAEVGDREYPVTEGTVDMVLALLLE